MKYVAEYIDQLMKSQGFDYTGYGNISSRSTESGLNINIWACTPASKIIAINRNADGTYHIDTNPTYNNFAPCIVKDNIAEEAIFETFASEMNKLA
jgi:hypothetical protein